MTTRTKVQEENETAAQWLRTPADEMNERYLLLEEAERDPKAYPISGDDTARRRAINKRKPRQN